PYDTPPGYTLGRYGSHFGRLNTWWKYGPQWISYLSRLQFILQQGEFTADICILHHDDLEHLNREELDSSFLSTMRGYDYDMCSQEDLLKITYSEGWLH